jgi:hypothetical protein
LEIDDKRPRKK